MAENRQPTTLTSNDELSRETTFETTATIEPSQTESEARRDGVLVEVARLPYEIRVRLADPILVGATTRVETPEQVRVCAHWAPSGLSDMIVQVSVVAAPNDQVRRGPGGSEPLRRGDRDWRGNLLNEIEEEALRGDAFAEAMNNLIKRI